MIDLKTDKQYDKNSFCRCTFNNAVEELPRMEWFKVNFKGRKMLVQAPDANTVLQFFTNCQTFASIGKKSPLRKNPPATRKAKKKNGTSILSVDRYQGETSHKHNLQCFMIDSVTPGLTALKKLGINLLTSHTGRR